MCSFYGCQFYFLQNSTKGYCGIIKKEGSIEICRTQCFISLVYRFCACYLFLYNSSIDFLIRTVKLIKILFDLNYIVQISAEAIFFLLLSLTSLRIKTGLLRFQNALTTNFQKASLTWEIDYYSYKKLPDKNSVFKNLEKSGRVATLVIPVVPIIISILKILLLLLLRRVLRKKSNSQFQLPITSCSKLCLTINKLISYGTILNDQKNIYSIFLITLINSVMCAC